MLNEEQLQYFCEAEARLSGVCVRFFRDREGKELAAIYGNHTAVRDMSTIPSDKVDFEGEGTIGLAYVEQFLLGRVLSEHDERTLVLGPVRMGELTESDIDMLMTKFGLPQALRGDISRFLMGTPVMPHENFLVLLSLFHLALNGNAVPMTEILTGGPMKDAPKEDYIDTVDIVQPRTSGEYEETIRYLIRNGMVDEIEKLRYESYQGIVGQLGPSQMRSLKNSLIILNSMCLRAAISGGLDTETAHFGRAGYGDRLYARGALCAAHRKGGDPDRAREAFASHQTGLLQAGETALRAEDRQFVCAEVGGICAEAHL